MNAEVEAYAGRHRVFGKALSIPINEDNAADGDITLGTWSDQSFSVGNSASINAVRVLTLRIRDVNEEVPMHFAALIGPA